MPEQIKPGSSICLAFDKFEASDLAFGLALTPIDVGGECKNQARFEGAFTVFRA